MSALTQLINTVSRHLQEKRIPHVLVGGIAVAIWGRPRATEDVDLIIDLREEQLEDLHAHLAEHGIRMDADAARRALQRGVSFPLYDEWSIHWVDARPPARDIDRIALARATSVELTGETVPVATPEDTLIGKLMAGNTQDFLDAKSILLRRGEHLDLPYIQNRVREFSLGEEWSKIRPEDPENA